MKIELKNLKVNLAFSEETTMFKADIYVNGKKTAYANNDGRGGCTFYNRYPNMENLLNEAENYAKTLPPIKYGKIEIDMNLEVLIDELVEKHLQEKETKKFIKKREKDTLIYIVYGLPDGKEYKMVGWKGHTIESIKKQPNGKELINNKVKELKDNFKNGEIIFNKNLYIQN